MSHLFQCCCPRCKGKDVSRATYYAHLPLCSQAIPKFQANTSFASSSSFQPTPPCRDPSRSELEPPRKKQWLPSNECSEESHPTEDTSPIHIVQNEVISQVSSLLVWHLMYSFDYILHQTHKIHGYNGESIQAHIPSDGTAKTALHFQILLISYKL